MMLPDFPPAQPEVPNHNLRVLFSLTLHILSQSVYEGGRKMEQENHSEKDLDDYIFEGVEWYPSSR